jgi:hypothetical protein
MTWRQVASILTIVFVAPNFVEATTPANSSRSGAVVPGRFAVKLVPTARISAISQSLGEAASFGRISRLETRPGMIAADEWRCWYSCTAANPATTIDSVRALIGAQNIEIIEPDYTIEFFSLPTDSLFSYQWYLHNTGQDFPSVYRRPGDFNDSLIWKHGTPGSDVNLMPLYQSAPAEHTAVVVAIVDTGVDPDHPDLHGRFWKNPDEISENGVDDDHNGFVDDTLGYDVSGDILSINNPQPDNDPTDIVGHGTHVAGIVAAAGNEQGIIGIAPHALIMPVKIRPNATTSVAAAGIIYAVNAGARIINISWGTGYRSLLVEDALRIARLNGVFVAIAAGNSGSNDRLYPAAGENAFAVAAGNADGLMASFSTFNPQIQLVAPGQDILSLRAANTDLYASANEPGVHIIDSEYYLADGTSMAAPVVAGAAALILSYRPDLDLSRLEDVLRFGADDLLDPRSTGANLPGRDTISGFGYINISASVNLLVNGGVYVVSPEEQSRLVDSMVIRIAPISGYTGGWELSWGKGIAPQSWNTLATGPSVPEDSVAIIIRSGDVPPGLITLRLTDNYQTSSYRRVTFLSGKAVDITSPIDGDTVNYFISIIGSAYGVDFDSVVIEYENGGGAPIRLGGSTAECFDTTIVTWSASGLPPGFFTLRVSGFFASGRIDRTMTLYIRSAFAAGWPQTLAGRSGLTPVSADLDHDGIKEMIASTASGIEVFRADGTRIPGFPALVHIDVRGIPAIYDVDRDQREEIIVTAPDGIHVVKLNGKEAVGWPRFFSITSSGFGYPTTTVTSFGAGSDSVVTFIDNLGTIRAFRLNGTPYLFSLGGKYANFSTGTAAASFFNGNSVTAADLNGDSRTEVIATFSSLFPGSGVNIFDGRTAQPAFGLPSASLVSGFGVYGTILADLSGDKYPEIVCVGYDASGARTVWVKTRGIEDFPGWPRSFPEIPAWRGNYPMVADLDLDGTPEVLVTFFELDIGVLYVFRADGTPFVDRPGRPPGEVFRTSSTLSSPTVGDLLEDTHPEIILRGGHILPGAGSESVHILTYEGTPVPGWPIATPADPIDVFSTPFAPLVDDIDGDGKAEMALISEPGVLYVWDFSASYDSTKTFGKILLDNRNGGILKPTKVPTDVGEDDMLLPTTTILRQNYPNPFNPSTIISFELPSRDQVRLDVYNLLGQRVRRLVDGSLPAGEYEVTFDGTGLASGAYFYKFEAGDYRETKKMLLLK